MKSQMLLLVGLWVLVGVSGSAVAQSVGPVPILKVEVVLVRGHDTQAFTQGLLLYDGVLFESTGRYGNSTLRRVDPVSGRVLQSVRPGNNFFGEGLARVDKRLIQLTWKEGVAFEYDLETLELVGAFEYSGEGWGLCFDGERLFMSDGSSTLFERNPSTFAIRSELKVTLNGAPVPFLNELECVGDFVYANVWRSDFIVQIDTSSGDVVAVIDAGGLLTNEEAVAADVLNGIAYDPERDTFMLTGKLWPLLFEVRFTESR